MSQIDIVVPDGSMQNVIMGLFAKAGLPVVIDHERTSKGRVEVDWIKRVVFQRPQEIPGYLSNAHFDVAIVGEDWITNWGYEFPVLLKMPIGRSGNKPVKIVLAVDQDSNLQRVEELPQGCEVATEYVQLVQRFFDGMGRSDIKILQSFGKTENKVEFGVMAIVDVTESGNSLRANGLKIICEIMESNTVVIANSKSLADASKRSFIDCFVRLIKGAFQASKYVKLVANVPMEVFREAVKIIGGLKGPSSSKLEGVEGWWALESFVEKDDEQKIIFNLLQIGVTDIVIERNIPLIMS